MERDRRNKRKEIGWRAHGEKEKEKETKR